MARCYVSGEARASSSFIAVAEARAVILERMRVKLLYFGVLKDMLGASEEGIDLPEGATAGDLVRILRERTSNILMEERLWQSLAVAINRHYASSQQPLREGDEVALLPPVSGGGAGER
jgi:molybdopterin converting factor subunit 1